MKQYQQETIDTYNTSVEKYEEARKDLVLHEEIDRLISLMPDKKILDIGCGPGRDSAIFVKKGLDVTGVDLSQGMIDYATKHVPEATFFVRDVLDLQFQDDEFDGIWCLAVLHHLKREDIADAFREIYRVLKPQGVMYFSAKAGSGERMVEEKEFDGKRRLFTYYTLPELEAIVQDTGFEIISNYIENDKDRFVKKDRDVSFINMFVKK